jgi:hypothetical protein
LRSRAKRDAQPRKPDPSIVDDAKLTKVAASFEPLPSSRERDAELDECLLEAGFVSDAT